MYQQSLLEPRPVQMARDHSEKFPDDFLEWLPENVHIFNDFCEEALKVIRRGYTHYSARTILEFLRHHSMTKEKSDSGYKINNVHTPYLARLFDLVYPHHAGLWEYRVTKKVHTDIAA